MIGPRIAFPLPAWKISGSPAKISLMCSGRVKSTSGRPPGIIQTVKVSPKRRCRYGTNWWRNRSSPALWAKTGQRSPGGSWSRRTFGKRLTSGRVWANRSSVSRATCSSVSAMTPIVAAQASRCNRL